MEKFDELLNELNLLNLIQTEIDWEENIPQDIYDKFPELLKAEHVDGGLLVGTHRWYETSVSVEKIFGRFLGIRHITNIFSESANCEDCYVTIKFFEMKEVQVTSYVKM